MVRSIRNGVNPMGPVTYEEEGLDGSIPIDHNMDSSSCLEWCLCELISCMRKRIEKERD